VHDGQSTTKRQSATLIRTAVTGRQQNISRTGPAQTAADPKFPARPDFAQTRWSFIQRISVNREVVSG
jgi:hypothetical protein